MIIKFLSKNYSALFARLEANDDFLSSWIFFFLFFFFIYLLFLFFNTRTVELIHQTSNSDSSIFLPPNSDFFINAKPILISYHSSILYHTIIHKKFCIFNNSTLFKYGQHIFCVYVCVMSIIIVIVFILCAVYISGTCIYLTLEMCSVMAIVIPNRIGIPSWNYKPGFRGILLYANSIWKNMNASLFLQAIVK